MQRGTFTSPIYQPNNPQISNELAGSQSYLIVLGKSVVVKNGKNQRLVKGFAIWKLEYLYFDIEKLVQREFTCLKEKVSLKKGFNVFL